MRINRAASIGGAPQPHAGMLLLAHPNLLDRNFRRSVILLSAHSEEGSVGVVVNRPLGQTLGEHDPELSNSPLSSVPLYSGGPVGAQQLILVAWKWSAEKGSFKLYFGIDGEKALRLQAEDSEYQLRGFLGHAGWGEGQLDAELDQSSWVLSGYLPALGNQSGVIDWHALLCHERPDLRLLADAPDDPSLN